MNLIPHVKGAEEAFSIGCLHELRGKIGSIAVPGVDSPCSPLHQVRVGVSTSRGNASKTRASRHGVCLK